MLLAYCLITMFAFGVVLSSLNSQSSEPHWLIIVASFIISLFWPVFVLLGIANKIGEFSD